MEGFLLKDILEMIALFLYKWSVEIKKSFSPKQNTIYYWQSLKYLICYNLQPYFNIVKSNTLNVQIYKHKYVPINTFYNFINKLLIIIY